ncbi:hypothetical protein [Runella sp.]|uniref:hypothetical protein n=1 Tax=Runella sp. TaxID=1960881 RepID=UPI003D0A42B3
MKTKVLLLRDSDVVPQIFVTILASPDYEVYQINVKDFDELLMCIITLQPDLIMCEDSFQPLILLIDSKINKRIPVLFFGRSELATSQLQIVNRSTAYLASPFKFEVFKAMVALLV